MDKQNILTLSEDKEFGELIAMAINKLNGPGIVKLTDLQGRRWK